MAPEPGPAREHEAPDVDLRCVLVAVGAFLAVVVVLYASLMAYERGWAAPRRVPARLSDFPGPQLQPNPRADWVEWRDRQRQDLESAGWTDKAQGLVHIPIERAMDLVLARGAAAYDPPEDAAPYRATPGPDGAPRTRPMASVAPYGPDR